MKKSKTAWLIIAFVFITVGIIIFLGALITLNFDFKKLSTEKYVTDTYVVTEDFNKININVTTAEIKFVLSDDSICKVECTDEEKLEYSTIVEDETLNIEIIDNRKWYDFIGINFKKASVILYLPKEHYQELKIESDTGDINIPSRISFENLQIEGDTTDIKSYASVTNKIKIETSTGDINLTDIKCKSLLLESNTGKIQLKNVVAQNSFKVESDTGNVKFEESDAQNILVKTSTGNITGTLLSEKIFKTETSTGNIKVPKTSRGGKCELKTNTGNIEIEIS